MTRVLDMSDFPLAEMDTTTELRLGAALTTMFGAQIAVHIASKSPLLFAMYAAPLGVLPPANWWDGVPESAGAAVRGGIR